MPITLDNLRTFAVARSLFPPTTLKRALQKFGFVQADPIRAPARAQDLILRHRVQNYRAGDLERCYHKLGIEEDFFVTYGFVTAPIHALMHPRADTEFHAETRKPWTATHKKRAQLLLQFIRDRGPVHPSEVDKHFGHGTVKNYFGGSSNATTHLLAAMHYRGMLRVARRDHGIRIYAEHQHATEPATSAERQARIDALVDVAARIYAPLPGACLTLLVRRLRYAVPQWRGELKSALQRAKQRLAHVHLAGVDWFWPPEEDPAHSAPQHSVRLLAPFDPIVWDRNRFELLCGWVYRFEAYTPAPRAQARILRTAAAVA